MRRAFRMLFGAATLGSLLLCLVTGGLWIRSYFVSDQIARHSGSFNPNGWRLLRCVTLRGAVQLEDFRIADPGPAYIRFADTTGWTYDQLEARSFPTWSTPIIPWVLNGGPGEWPEFGPVSLWPPASAKLYRDQQVNDGVTNSWRGAVIPLWLLLVATSAFPAARCILWRRTIRRTRGRLNVCFKCGYDLRATPDRCPECGAVPHAKEARLPGAEG
jgi:hypothetical protein